MLDILQLKADHCPLLCPCIDGQQEAKKANKYSIHFSGIHKFMNTWNFYNNQYAATINCNLIYTIPIHGPNDQPLSNLDQP